MECNIKPETKGIKQKTERTGTGTQNVENNSIEFGALENRVMGQVTTRTRGWNPRFEEKGDGTSNHKNECMELKTPRMKRKNLEALWQGNGTQKAKNVIENETSVTGGKQLSIPRTRGSTLQCGELGEGNQNPPPPPKKSNWNWEPQEEGDIIQHPEKVMEPGILRKQGGI